MTWGLVWQGHVSGLVEPCASAVCPGQVVIEMNSKI